MSLGINTEYMKTQFLKHIEEIAECEFDAAKKKIHSHFEAAVSELWDSLFEKFEDISKVYQIQEKNNMCGELKYVYISYLRSSMLKGDPYYRIDFYDGNDRYSEVGGTGDWSFSYVYSHFVKIREKVEKELKEQTRVKYYEIMPILYGLSDRFQKETSVLFPSIIKYGFQKIHTIGYHDCNIYLGEFFDYSEMIFKID